MSLTSFSLKTARLVTASIAVVSLVALALLAAPVKTKHHRTVDLALVGPAISSAAPTPSITPTPSVSPTPTLSTAPSAPSVATTSPSGSSPASSIAPTSSSAPPSGSSSPSTVAAVASCPVGLKVPAETGGLQSLISLSSAFGPLSAEAFAAAPAYAPLLTLLGPILAQYPALAPQFAAFTNPLIQLFASLTSAGFAVLAPLYDPYREQVLSAEATFAAAFAPLSKALVNSPVGSCAIAIESILVDPASASSILTR